MPASAPRKLTYEDYCRIPEDLQRHEILDGVEVVSPSPGTRHQRTILNLGSELRTWARANSSGEVFVAPFDVLLGPHDVVQPDVLFVSAARAAIVTEANIQGSPDLLVEVLSPSSPRNDLILKRDRYAAARVPEYWVVDPVLEQVQVFRLRDGARPELEKVAELWAHRGDRLESPVLPGFSVALAEVFAG